MWRGLGCAAAQVVQPTSLRVEVWATGGRGGQEQSYSDYIRFSPTSMKVKKSVNYIYYGYKGRSAEFH